MEACGLAACWLRPSLPGNIALAPMLAIDVVGSRRWVGVVANGVDAAALPPHSPELRVVRIASAMFLREIHNLSAMP